MSDFANALAELLTKMDQKLDALEKQQRELDSKLERYSAFIVKKLNETSETICNTQTAQLKLFDDGMRKMGQQLDVMERLVAGRTDPDAVNDPVMAKLTETSDALQHTVERSINLISYHSAQIEKTLAAAAQAASEKADEEAARAEALSRKLSFEFEHLHDELLTNHEIIEKTDAVPENPQAVPEELEAFPENPDGNYENPEIEVFENPEAFPDNPEAYPENPEPSFENPEPVIET
ncbi:MAG: hypothetical protein MJ065_06495 [Oscillospiraceae bacterium]|nr:hypothetical protein [Oscillospiraceae bacterium]